MQTDLDFTIDLARQTGALLQEHFSPDGLAAQRKADNSVVTQADLAADRLIIERIQSAYPSDAIITEEQFTALQGPSRPTWVVDPLDGTTNFSLGIPIWGVSIARLVNGWPVTGVVYFPLLNECYSAERGAGAFYNGAPLKVTPPTAYDRRQQAFACCGRTYLHYNVSVPYKYRIFGSTAYNLCCVARGAALVSFDTVAKLWDIAAAWLIVGEAGGAVACLNDEKPFPALPGGNFLEQHFPTLGAATPELLAATRRQIEPRKPSPKA
ncbi:MAG: inositol monophosphatase family protein [Chloroflexota bacterium]